MICPSHIANIQLNWHPSRTKCFFQMALGVALSRSVQMQRIAAHFQDDTSLEGRVQRIQRFIAEQAIDPIEIALVILKFLELDDKALNLVLDRTNWQFGSKNINYLVLGVQTEGRGVVPLLWVELSKKGNSNTDERKSLLDMLFAGIPNVQIASLTVDREFIGKNWVTYLMTREIPFYIRIKQNCLVDWSGQMAQAAFFFNHLRVGDRPRKLYKTIDGHDLVLVGVRSKDGELVIILTNVDQNHKKVLEIYKSRWGIECLFKNLKGNGFNLEDTHITMPERLEKLMAICAFATALCITIGMRKHALKPIPYKRTVKSYLYSFFQYGLNHLRSGANTLMQKIAYIKNNLIFHTVMCLKLKNEG